MEEGLVWTCYNCLSQDLQSQDEAPAKESYITRLQFYHCVAAGGIVEDDFGELKR